MQYNPLTGTRSLISLIFHSISVAILREFLMIDPLLMMSAITYWWNLGLLNKMPLTSLGFIQLSSTCQPPLR